jgi:ArsR family transcriptional regulator
MLKAAAEPTRLRVLMLLRQGELNVKDLTRILGQSQPRISRHLKLMLEAGLIERHRDGSWAYFQLVDTGAAAELLDGLLGSVETTDALLVRDAERATGLKREREAAAQSYFRSHAAEWDRIRALHVSESKVEQALKEALDGVKPRLFLDLGTGTGRMLELFAADYGRGIGLDMNQSMLDYARGRLEAAGITHASVRHGDLYDIGLANATADAVVMHQVLHFLAEPALAIREAARVLSPGGRLVIADFAPHGLEFLRDAHAHERLGFAAAQVEEWLVAAGLGDVAVRELRPEPAALEAKLTVILWTAERPQAEHGGARTAPRRKVEA